MVRKRSNTPGPVRCLLSKCQTYYYCTCGKSKRQPYCDNSHKGTKHLPIKYHSTEDNVVVFCGCKLSKSPPYCDGSHKSISQDKAKEIVDNNVG